MSETKNKIFSLLHKISKEEELQNPKIKLTPISSGGANYTSTLYTATVTSENSDDLHLFIKVAAIGEKMRNMSDFKIYETENFIYTKLKVILRNLEVKHCIAETDRLPMSKYYGSNTTPLEEMIVLENLVSKGFTTHDRLVSVGWKYATSAVRELTKLHALSMALQRENPEEFSKLLQHFQFKTVDFEGMEALFETSKKSALNVVREENFERLNKFLNGTNLPEIWSYYKASRCEVLMHGDFRPSNLMHRVQTDGSVEVIPVDYQTLRGGGPVVDLLYFIFTGTDKAFRDQYYEKLIDHYYSELHAALVRLGLDPEEKYSRKDFDDELKEKLPFGLGIAVFTLPIVTVEAENAPTVDENMDFTSFSIKKTGSLFPERLNGVVDDYVRWGVI